MSLPAPIPFLDGSTKDLRAWRVLLRRGGQEWLFDHHDLHEPPEISVDARLLLEASPRRVYSSAIILRLRSGAPALAALFDDILLTAGTWAADVSLYGAPGTPGSPHPVGTFVLQDLREAEGVAEIRLHRDYPVAARPLCRDASAVEGLRHLAPGTWLPQVFGRAGLEPPPLFLLSQATLDADLEVDATELVLIASVGWLPVGRAQINDEVLEYRGLSEDGRRLLSLVRPSPRRHRRRSPVVLLPSVAPSWCLCDHPGAVREVRLNNADGDLLEAHTVAVESLGGRSATVLRRAALPLVIGHARSLRQVETPLDRYLWRVLAPTSAYDPYEAFAAADPQQGAVLTRERPLLRAAFHRNPSLEEDRFDRVEHAALLLEYSDTPGWMETTRLRVSIIHGSARIDRLFDREGRHIVQVIRGEGLLPSGSATLLSTRWVRHGFDRVEPEGYWENLPAVVDGHMQDATGIDTPVPSALHLRFLTTPPEVPASITALRLCAAVANPSVEPLVVRLAVRIPGELDRHLEFTLAGGASDILRFELALPGNVSAAMVFAAATRFSVELPAGGAAAVREAWLEAGHVGSASTAGLASTRLPVLATLDLRLVYNKLEIDIDSMLPGEDRWGFFSSTVEPLVVEMELLNPPTHPLWDVAVRNVHWRLTTLAATSVRPTTRLHAVVDGRAARADGTANPATIAREILRDPLMGALGDSSLDSGSFAASAAACDGRDLAIAAAFAEETRVGGALESLLGECALVLAPSASAWTLVATPQDPASVIAPLLEDRHRHASGAERRLVPAEPERSLAPSIHRPGLGPLFVPRGVGGAPFRVRWLARGGAFISRWIESRFIPALSIRILPVDVALLPIPAGTLVGIPDSPDATLRLQGEVSAARLRRSKLEVELAHARRVQVREVSPGAAIVRGLRAGSWWFLIAGRAVARLDDGGDLLIAGEFTQAPLEGALPSSSLIYDPARDALMLIHTAPGGAASGMAIDSAGNLRTPLLLREGVMPTQPSSPDGFVNLTSAAIAGGAPGATVPLAFNLTEILLRGSLHTHQVL